MPLLSRDPDTGKTHVGFSVCSHLLPLSAHLFHPTSLWRQQSSLHSQKLAVLQASEQQFSLLLDGLNVTRSPHLACTSTRHFAKLTQGGMIKMVTGEWLIKRFTPVTEIHCKQCLICAAQNPGKPVSTQQTAHPLPQWSFEHLMIDFIDHLLKGEGIVWWCWTCGRNGLKPAKHATVPVIVKALLTEVIPR